MVKWKGFNHITKRKIVQEWIRYQKEIGNAGNFLLPGLFSPQENEKIFGKKICRNALTNILDIGQKKWNTSAAMTHQTIHGNKGKSNKSKPYTEVFQSLH